jgi:cobalt-zinc-cadmium efflux system membrane fusion protein
VKKGDALAQIVSPDIGQASADLGKAAADLLAAEHDLKRKRALYEDKAGSIADYEVSQDNYRQAKAEKSRAEMKVALLRAGSVDVVTQTYTLRAPIDGEVIARLASPGIEVQGQYGGGTAAELFTIGELDEVWVLADVYEDELPRVHVGSAAHVEVFAAPGRVLDGAVDWVSGTLDPTTRTARVRCVFKNTDRVLKPEMFATVRLIVPERHTPAVPRGAVVRFGEQPIVFVETGVVNGKTTYERMPVTVDERVDGPFVPVTHGLDPGAKVVVNGAAALAGKL